MIVFYSQGRLQAWQRSEMMREVCISRDGPCCVYCGCNLLADPKLFATMTLDHFIPRRLGGANAVTNRVLACFACDRLKAGRLFRDLDQARQFIAQAYAEADAQRAKWPGLVP